MPPPTATELEAVLAQITERIARHLERRGLLVRDLESSHLTRAPGEEAALEILQGHSITYRIAVGPHEGRKAFTLQTVPASERSTKPFLANHAGRVRYTLKTPYRDGTTHVVFEPLECMRHIPVPHPFGAACGCANRQSCRFVIARLAALVPKPRVHLTRFHGVFAPHSQWRAQITPAGRGSGAQAVDTRTPAERHRAMTWAQRLKRVFKLDLTRCENCGGQVRVIASIEDPVVIGKILAHREKIATGVAGAGRRPEVRGPPPGTLEPG